MKVGIYVGSFDPVHIGHLKIAQCLVDKYLDKVIFVPTGNYWDKKNLLPIEHRINMIKLCIDNGLFVQEEGNELQYTYQFLEFISQRYPNDEIYLIIGADNIVNFDKWKDYQEVLKYHLVIIKRNGIDIKHYLKLLGKDEKDCIIPDELENIDISSTKIRECIRNNDMSSLDSMLDSRVLEYILKNKLYLS